MFTKCAMCLLCSDQMMYDDDMSYDEMLYDEAVANYDRAKDQLMIAQRLMRLDSNVNEKRRNQW